MTPTDSGQETAQYPPVPAEHDQRILSLDVLRGLALLGALLISIWEFGGFSFNQQTNLITHPHGGNYRLYAFVSLMFEGKMRALIALVFGAGMVLFVYRHGQKDRTNVADLFIRRNLWLIFFGLINALVFLWTQDILFHLGVMGVLMFPFTRMSAKGAIITAMVVLCIHSAKIYWYYADDKTAYKKYTAVLEVEKKIKKDSADRAKKDSLNGIAMPVKKDSAAAKAAYKDTLTKEQKEDKQKWEGIAKQYDYDKKKDEGNIKTMRTGEYGKLWNSLLGRSQQREAQWTYQFGIWDLASLILLGMGLFKMGFFSRSWSNNRFVLLALAGIGIGLLLGWLRLYLANGTLIDYERYVKGHFFPYKILYPFERAVMAIGYGSVVVLLIRWNILRWLQQALAAVGRLSLSNYLLQSIVCTLFFTGYGMTYFGKLNQWQLYLFVVELWLVQCVVSIFWLKYYQMGPAEWLWRWLTELKRPPMKRSSEAESAPDAPAE